MVRAMSEILLCSEPAVLFQSTEEVNLNQAKHFEKIVFPYEGDFQKGLKEDQCTLVSVLAKDALGQFIFKSLEESGINLAPCGLTGNAKSAIWLGTASEKPVLQTSPSGIDQLMPSLVDRLDLYQYNHLHVSGNLLGRTQSLYQSLLHLMARASRSRLPVSVDLSNHVDHDYLKGLIHRVDWFVVDNFETAKPLLKLDATRVIVRSDEMGAYVYESGNEIYIPGKSQASLAEFSGLLIHYSLQDGHLLKAVRQAMG